MDNKDKAKDKRLQSTYGITLEEWNKIYFKQRGRCEVCYEMPKNGKLCVDHRHVKGYKKLSSEDKKKEVRALVCFRCNRYLVGPIEKYFKYPRRTAGLLVEYLNNYKTKEDK